MKCPAKGLAFMVFLVTMCMASLPSRANVTGDYALKKVFSFNLKDKPVKDVLSYIEKNSEFIFFYSTKAIDTDRRVSVNVVNKPVTSVLDQIFAGTDIRYDIADRQISLKIEGKKPKAANAAPSSGTRRVTGTVIDSSNDEPLIGATVTVAGVPGAGVSTDIDGNFTIEIPTDGALNFSYIGFDPQRVRPGDKDHIEVRMMPDNKVLDEIVVIGYGTTTRKNLTTSIATVKTDKVQKAASSSVQSLLLGRAAGLQATVNSTQPGGDINISIRGGGNPIY
ncbi:MAG: carboxypeptidase-like regulatory domain-containing protein, partial [Muribaculaceae bacterium]|nr:carboxypeptidase-like regulatory domain-containing protein [Muribaculaceae bacterium]